MCTFCRYLPFHQEEGLGTCCNLPSVLKSPSLTNPSQWICRNTGFISKASSHCFGRDLGHFPELQTCKHCAGPSLRTLPHKLPLSFKEVSDFFKASFTCCVLHPYLLTPNSLPSFALVLVLRSGGWAAPSSLCH